MTANTKPAPATRMTSARVQLGIAAAVIAVILFVVASSFIVERLTGKADGVARAGEPGSIRGHVNSRYLATGPAVVYVKDMVGRTFSVPTERAVMTHRGRRFTPHLLPILVGTTVEFINDDTVAHDVRSEGESATTIELGREQPDGLELRTFDEPGVTHLGCNIHAEMSGYVVTVQNPWFVVTETDGQFVLNDVPPGTYRLTFFQEHIHSRTLTVSVKPGQATEVEFAGLLRRRTPVGVGSDAHPPEE